MQNGSVVATGIIDNLKPVHLYISRSSCRVALPIVVRKDRMNSRRESAAL